MVAGERRRPAASSQVGAVMHSNLFGWAATRQNLPSLFARNSSGSSTAPSCRFAWKAGVRAALEPVAASRGMKLSGLEALLRLASCSAAPPFRDLGSRLRAEVHGGEHSALADRALRGHRAELAREAARVVVSLNPGDLAVLDPSHVAALDVHLLARRCEALEAARAVEGSGHPPADRGTVVVHDEVEDLQLEVVEGVEQVVEERAHLGRPGGADHAVDAAARVVRIPVGLRVPIRSPERLEIRSHDGPRVGGWRGRLARRHGLSSGSGHPRPYAPQPRRSSQAPDESRGRDYFRSNSRERLSLLTSAQSARSFGATLALVPFYCRVVGSSTCY